MVNEIKRDVEFSKILEKIFDEQTQEASNGYQDEREYIDEKGLRIVGAWNTWPGLESDSTIKFVEKNEDYKAGE
mgnify:CR=1 FL=1